MRALTEVQALLTRGATLLVSDLVIAEVYFAMQYHYGISKDTSLLLIGRFLAESGVKPLGAAMQVLSTPNLAKANPGFVDRMIHAEYVRSAGEMLTFEKTGARLECVRVRQ